MLNTAFCLLIVKSSAYLLSSDTNKPSIESEIIPVVTPMKLDAEVKRSFFTEVAKLNFGFFKDQKLKRHLGFL